MPQLGETVFYESNTNGIKGYSSMPYAGNDPYGFIPVTREQYITGLQDVISRYPNETTQNNIFNTADNQRKLQEALAMSNTFAPGYLDPQLGKFSGPTPSAEYLKPEYRAQYDQGMLNLQNQIYPVGSPADIAAKGGDPYTANYAGTPYANVQPINPTSIINNAQRAAMDAIKGSPTTDPNALREKASQAISTTVGTQQTALQQLQARMDSLIGQVQQYMANTSAETDLGNRIRGLDTSYEKGVNAIRGEPVALSLQQGQSAALERQYTEQRNALVRQLQSETASRQQKLEAAKFLYDATRNTLSDTIQLMKATAPENIATFTNKDTGDQYIVMRNPITGEVYNQKVGNTGTPEKWKENRELAIQIGAIGQPFYMVGQEIRNSATGEAYSTWEGYLAAGGDPNLGNVFKYQGEQKKASDYDLIQDAGTGAWYRVDKVTNTVTPVGVGSAPSGGPAGSPVAAPSAPAGKSYTSLYGAITGPDGSSAWKYGVDIDLKKGDAVYSPVNGTVIAAAENGGFGNQVKIRDANGNEIWLSHLDSGRVKVGDKVTAGQIVGIGGNTGKTFPGKGGDGSHLDLTVKTSKGYMSAREAAAYVNQQFAGYKGPSSGTGFSTTPKGNEPTEGEKKLASANQVIDQARQVIQNPAQTRTIKLPFLGNFTVPASKTVDVTAVRRMREDYFRQVGNTSGFDNIIGAYLTAEQRAAVGIYKDNSQDDDFKPLFG